MKKLKKPKILSCSENLNQMKPTEKGRFCGSCQKEIIDFRGFSIEEILKIHDENKGQVCGIYLKNHFEDQAIEKEVNFLPPLKFIAAGLLAFIGPDISHSHIDIKSKQVIEWSLNVPKPFDINGTIKSKEGEPISGAKIYIEELNLETISNKNGSFQLVLAGVKVITGYTLTIEHSNYEKVTQRLTESSFNTSTSANIKVVMDKTKSKNLQKDTIDQINYTIKGNVKHKITGEPIPFVNVFTKKSIIGVVADIDGNFSFEISSADSLKGQIININSIGYKAKQVTVNPNSINEKNEIVLNIELEEHINAIIMGVLIDPPEMDEIVHPIKIKSDRVRGIPLHKKLFRGDRKIFGR